MNGTSNLYSIQNRNNNNIQLIDRLLAIYSLLLILIGTPCNLLCCIIYFQKANRSNSIKIIFGYLAFLDTIVLYTFNLNYVIREFNSDFNITNITYNNSDKHDNSIYVIIIKKNLEEYSVLICRFLSYLAFSTLQTSSWVLAFGSFNRYLLIKKLSHFEFICKRPYTIAICLFFTCLFFFSNMHILFMNGYRSSSGRVTCYGNLRFPSYMVLYQRLHLFIYSLLPSFILFILNTLLMRIIFASKKRLDNHRRLVLFAAAATTTLPTDHRKSFLALQHLSSATLRRPNKNNPARLLNRHSRKLTMSLIFITISYFTLTFPSTVIFSFIRPYITQGDVRRTLSLLFTNLSTTTHTIRFFIYFFCSIDFRNDFYNLILPKRSFRLNFIKNQGRQQQRKSLRQSLKQTDSLLLSNKNEPVG
ncbi:unnamed protein product [Adineta steineri]|uniref:G-protein coupled receptors family 1 profile domain-containing protein n=1 Tax=Adineta steineri TaxID=433720 RepID=A0A814CJL5_9BILA|nr:unnamed protein product [Adineta steineri]CAF3559978.1 unnamed protein product [Adineta steineri]